MFWAAFGWMKRTALVPMNGDLESARGGVTARVYRAVLEEYLPTILNADSIFMQDGASIHTAKIIKEFFSVMGIIIMEWPPYSPDLNPIENLWAILKVAIYRRYPDLEHAPNTDETLNRLIDAAIEVWDSIRDEILCNLSDKMPKRVEAVRLAEGWYTKY
jgi:transposase